jgi:hypothetical protein
MNQKQAARIAVDCIKKEMQKIAYNANSAELMPNAPASMHRDLDRYRKYVQAIQVLEGLYIKQSSFLDRNQEVKNE